MRYSIKLSYCGAGFHGWQTQPNAASIQETMEKALSTLLRRDTRITGAGRTDTGVNAIGYVAHFDADTVPDTEQLAYKLNAILPPSICVHSIEAADDGFNARFSATKREYTYFLHRVKDPFARLFSYQYTFPELDFGLMNKAASLLCGTHDFRCFEKTGSDSKSSICTVREAAWHEYAPALAAWDRLSPAGEPNYWYFRISADRFLRNMVRSVVGTLLEVGRGKRSVDEFASIILPPYTETDPSGSRASRCSAGESVPGEALFLTKVEY